MAFFNKSPHFLVKLSLFIGIALLGKADYLYAQAKMDGGNNISDSVKIIRLINEADSLKFIDFHRANDKARLALTNAWELRSADVLYRALTINSLLNWYDGYHEQSISQSLDALTIARQLNDVQGMARRYQQIGLAYLYKADYDSALFYNNLALQAYSDLRDTTRILKIHGFIGLVYDFQAKHLEAKENLLATVKIKRLYKTTDWSILQLPAGGHNNAYYELSLENAKQSVQDLSGDVAPTLQKRYAYHNLGLTYLNLELPDSALFYFKKAAEVARALNADIYWNEFARAYIFLGEFDSAIWAHKKALWNAVDHGTRISQATSYSVLGKAYKAINKNEEAIAAFKQQLLLDRAMGHKYAMMYATNLIAECANSMKDPVTSLVYSDSSLHLAKQIGAGNGYVQALHSQYEAYKLLGNDTEALLTLEEYNRRWEIIHKQVTELELAKLDLYNEIELNKIEIDKLNKEQELSAVILDNRELTIFIILILASMTGVMLLLNYIRTRKLLKLNIQLNKQQEIISTQYNDLRVSHKQKEALVGEIHHRVKNNLQVISSLLSAQQLQLTEESARNAVAEGQNRVQAIGLIHESLYHGEIGDKVVMQDYLHKLVSNLINVFGFQEDEIDLQIEAAGVKLSSDIGINIGLIINELVMNAMKHGFKGFNGAKKLSVTLHFPADGCLEINVVNNGLVKEFDWDNSRLTSFGLKLVNQLITKYNGQLKINVSEYTQVNIHLKV